MEQNLKASHGQVGEKRRKTVFRCHDVTTVKVTSDKLISLSKMLRFLQSNFKATSVSNIILSRDTWQYYAYLNIVNSEVNDKLQEVTPYGDDKP